MTTLKEDSSDCFVCRKHRGEIGVPGGAIYEDALVYDEWPDAPRGGADEIAKLCIRLRTLLQEK
jgi:hypothetical protein